MASRQSFVFKLNAITASGIADEWEADIEGILSRLRVGLTDVGRGRAGDNAAFTKNAPRTWDASKLNNYHARHFAFPLQKIAPRVKNVF
ncbi:hypothetical protein CKA38_11970 [Ereboglobus luteus]|uniref:Uncharacterized protein n=1 Tax=Ereboglobus luteus TaxID=1796921 RepID=A0A2U8E4M0_9BACT|nr:hypothetical protein CKA38_11970 [Ereboglobus luteus]